MKYIEKVILLSEETSFRSYLQAELSKKYEIHTFGIKDISEEGLSNFTSALALIQPSCIINALPLSFYEKHQEYGPCIQRSLIGTESFYLEVKPFNFTKNAIRTVFKPYSALVHSAFIEIGLMHSFRTNNLITNFLERVKGKRKLTLKDESSVPLISERMAAKYLQLFLSKASLNFNLIRNYQLCENGFPRLSDVFQQALSTASKINPSAYKAQLFFHSNSKPSFPSFDNSSFQMDAEVILGDWKDGVIETASGWVSEH